MLAFRYDDTGNLVTCEGRGHSFVEIDRTRLPPPTLRLPRIPEFRCEVGLYAADLVREAALPGGPPAWFKPNASRRRRWALWNATPPQRRKTLAPDLPISMAVPTRRMVGHPFRGEITVGPHHEVAGLRPGSGRRVVDALLYLPQGEKPNPTHERDLDRVVHRHMVDGLREAR